MMRLVVMIVGWLIWSNLQIVMAHPLDITSTTLRADGASVLVETRMTARQVAIAFLGKEHDFEGRDVSRVEAELLRAYEKGVVIEHERVKCRWQEGMIQYDSNDTVQLLLEGIVIRGRFECAEVVRQPLVITISLFTEDFPDQQNVLIVGEERPQQYILTPSSREVTVSEGVSMEIDNNRGHEGLFAGFWYFVWLGIEHVAIGYDHILFMIGIYLVVRERKQLLYVISSFTIAHSITLIAATLEWVTLPSSMVEAAIAATIVFIGVENIIRRQFTYRPVITFGLGLIHGLGFSSVLREIRIPDTNLLQDIIGFNVGVEVGQLLIVAALWPAMWWLGRRPAVNTFVVYWVSIVISIVGLVWFLQRVDGIL